MAAELGPLGDEEAEEGGAPQGRGHDLFPPQQLGQPASGHLDTLLTLSVLFALARFLYISCHIYMGQRGEY